MKQEYWYGIVLVLMVLVTFFATRYYRDEQIFAMNAQIVKTNEMLNTIQWDKAYVERWNSIGYAVRFVEPKGAVK